MLYMRWARWGILLGRMSALEGHFRRKSAKSAERVKRALRIILSRNSISMCQSGMEKLASSVAPEAPRNWPLIQSVPPPSWLPDGWTAQRLTRENGIKANSYEDPVCRRRFRSEAEIKYFLETGKSFRSRKAADERLCHKLKLQELGKKLCQQAIQVFRDKDLERKISQQICRGQSTSMNHWQNGNLEAHSNCVSSPVISSTFHTFSTAGTTCGKAKRDSTNQEDRTKILLRRLTVISCGQS